MTTKQRDRITSLEICPLPAPLFAEFVRGSGGVVWAGLARRAAIHARRIESVAVASDVLGRSAISSSAREIQDAAADGEDATRFLNSPVVGMWLQAAVVCLDREADQAAVSKMAGSTSVEAVDSCLCRMAELCVAESAGHDLPSYDSESCLAKEWVPGLRDPSTWLLPDQSLASLLQQAWLRVGDVLPELAGMAKSILSRVVGHRMKAGRLVSSTFSEMLGCIYVTEHVDDALLGEQLVHETAHTMLFAAQTLDDLVLESWVNESWEDARYYSPWRQDPRPLNGVLHGCFVFHEVARYWLRQPISAPARAGRLGLLTAQLQAGLETLKTHGKWTSAGRAFFSELSQQVDATLSEVQTSVNGSRVPAVDIESLDCEAPVDCEQHALRHRNEWVQRNGAIVGSTHA